MSQNRTRPDAGWTDGKVLNACRYCGGPLPKGRRSFCCGARTKHGERVVREPGATYGRRERFVDKPGHGCVHEWCVRTNPGYARQCVRDRDGGVCALCGRYDTEWQADHIVPVVEGGGECGLDNLRTLCSACHKAETAALARRRAEARRQAAPQLGLFVGTGGDGR